MADESSSSRPLVVGGPYSIVPSLTPDPQRHRAQLEAIMEIAWDVSTTLHIDSLLPRIMHKVTQLMRADRSTFFVVDRERGELWSKVIEGAKATEVRLRVGEGIAGWVAQSGQALRLKDAHRDPRFDARWDEGSGYETKSLLCVPIFNRQYEVIAVIQCLNKQGRPFDDEDQELLTCIGGQCAVAIESSFLYESLLQRNRDLVDAEGRLRAVNTELEILYDVEQQISEAQDLATLLSDTLERACGMLRVEAGAVLLVDELGGHLYRYRQGFLPLDSKLLEPRASRAFLIHSKVPIRRQRDIGGALADTLIEDGEGLIVRETFTAPLTDGRSQIGLVQIANRCDASQTEEGALRLLSVLAGQVARAIVVRREREAAEHAGRLALLGHSVGAILHDLRTPMTAVGGFAEIMAEEDDPSVRRQHAERISRALDHMEKMTQEVLAFARGQREVLVRKVYLNRFIESVREMLLPETERFGVELVVDASYEGMARFDENKITRVLFNLARNACEAMSDGGRFTWRIMRDGEQVVFECEDTGPGIPREMEGRLFESFATHGKSDGTGLGLAMARKIVDAHCGQISCRSEPGLGSTFRIELPV